MMTQASKPLRLAVLLSGSGRTLQNIADAIADGQLNAQISLVLSSKPDVFGLQRAANLHIPSKVVSRKEHPLAQDFSQAIWQQIRPLEVDYVCLAGFMSLLTIPDDFAGRVINIHPALLPSFGGKGMYGHHVHEAVLAQGCKVSGCTVHLCDNTYDTGPILVQRTCPVLTGDTPDDLAGRVFEQECLAYIEALQLLSKE